MRSIRVTFPTESGPRSYPIYVADGASRRLPAVVRGLDPSRVAIVTEPVVWRLHGGGIARDLTAAGFRPHVVRIAGGEKNKNAAGVQRIYDGLLTAGMDRASLVVALGGGIVGDLAGFAASSYYRGIPYIQVPTTLLAQVDSSVGGKTGYNLPQGKNLVGAFHHPVAVLADVGFLRTLPPRQVRAALAEVVKVGVVRSRALFVAVERHHESIESFDSKFMSETIRGAVRVKAEVVAADEREAGLRRILNFGHTVGHAIEAAAGYRGVLHGEAVALGMLAETRLGERLGVTLPEVLPRLKNLLFRLGLPDRISRKRLHAAAEWIHYDKKFARASIRMFLPSALGSAEDVTLARRDLTRHIADLEA